MNELATYPALRTFDACGYRVRRRTDVLRRRPLQGCGRTRVQSIRCQPGAGAWNQLNSPDNLENSAWSGADSQ